MPPSRSESEPSCRHIVFEALFVHGLGLATDTTLAEGLRGAGFDWKAPSPEYPASVFGKCLTVAMKQRFSNLPELEALRVLGTQFVSGILNTMLGKVVAVAILLTGPDRSIKRIPSLIKSDYGMAVTATMLESRHYEISSGPGLPAWAGHVFQGIFEEALRRTRVIPASTVKRGKEMGSFVLDIRWSEAA